METKSKLALLVSKQCDVLISNGVADRFIHQCYDKVEDAITGRDWSAIRSNSITLTAAFGLNKYPPADQYDSESLAEQYVERCTHVLAFWGGGPRFVDTLRLAIKAGKKVRIFSCDLKTHQVKLIPNSAIAEESW